MKSLFLLAALGAVLCGIVASESSDNADNKDNSPLVKTPIGTKRHRLIRPLPVHKEPALPLPESKEKPEPVKGSLLVKTPIGTQRHRLIRPLPARKVPVENPAKPAPESEEAEIKWWVGVNPAQNTTNAPESTRTTYNWGQHTSTQSPNQNSTGASNGTTYDWGQHTGSTFDWGKYTSTKAPNNGNQNSTAASNGTTYDWGQHTGSTFDWGKYTSTKAPNNGNQNSTASPTSTTYNWGQHTGSTYDWGQHTKPTQGPNQNGTDNGHNNNGTDNNQNQHKCGAGSYSCAGALGLCLELKKICDGTIDCPNADDEEPRVCHPAYVPVSNAANINRFRGQGFMFHIRKIKINGGSHVKLFNQQSDNNVQKSG